MNNGFNFGSLPAMNHLDLNFAMPVAGPGGDMMSGVGNAVSGADVGGGTTDLSGADTPGGPFGAIGGLEGLSTILKGLGSIGQIFTAMKGLKIAKEQLAFSKEAYQTNLKNQTQTYNTSLEDRIRSRYYTEGKSADQVSSYLAKHSL